MKRTTSMKEIGPFESPTVGPLSSTFVLLGMNGHLFLAMSRPAPCAWTELWSMLIMRMSKYCVVRTSTCGAESSEQQSSHSERRLHCRLLPTFERVCQTHAMHAIARHFRHATPGRERLCLEGTRKSQGIRHVKYPAFRCSRSQHRVAWLCTYRRKQTHVDSIRIHNMHTNAGFYATRRAVALVWAMLMHGRDLRQWRQWRLDMATH